MTTPHLTFESADGVDIAVADYRGCSVDEFLARVRLVRDWIVLQPPRSAVVLTLAAGVSYRPDAMRELVAILRQTKPHIRASAIVGLGHLTLLIRVINRLAARDVEAFEDIDEARSWLREQARKPTQP
ncbi:MAG: hypothetical protein NDJ92_20065 [Thermoanaerobaculia bacterium]|nr:hypothetical protein [Thermoanaerobaculia bacterium]